MLKFGWIALLALACFASGCTDASIKAADGSTVGGPMMNGQISYSAGAACAQVQPNPATPIPAPAPAPAPLTLRQVCDGNGANCMKVLMADTPPAPTCFTQTATVRGTDLTTYFGWAMAGFAAAAVAFGGGL